jgi:hypothetical protein
MNEDQDRDRILHDLESGQIDVDEALRRLDRETAGPVEETEITPRPKDGWLILFAGAIALMALGGWLGSLGGWWWLGGGPALALGVAGVALAVVSRTSPWVVIRVTSRESGRRRFTLGLPVPVRQAAWSLRVFGPWIPALNRTAVDDLLMALDGQLSNGRPLHVLIDDEGEGERVEVYLG